MIYTANNILHERNQIEVKISVAFERFKKWFKGEEMDTKKIDKMIYEIEKCNKKIERYRSASDEEKKKIRKDLENNKELVAKYIRELFWIIPACGAFMSATAINVMLGGVVTGMYVMLVNERLSIDNFYRKLEAENNKALEWLKEERDTINFKKNRNAGNEEKSDEDVKTESTIFESVLLI